MFLDLSLLKNNLQFRKLFIGQTVSFFGSMMSYVAIPYQAYEITKNSFLVGLISSIQLIPLLLAGLYGGALADSVDRRKLMILSEWGLFVCTLGLILNCLLPEPTYIGLVLMAGLSSALVGIHRPAFDALTPQIVDKKDLTSAAALSSIRYAIGAVAGPALGGILIARFGAITTYAIDSLTFLISILALNSMKSVTIPEALEKVSLSSIAEGLRYALKTPVILGTYFVDIFAMVFAMPLALYPQLADEFQQQTSLGVLYAALPLGTVAVSLFSKILNQYDRQGAGVIVSATIWGVCVFIMAFCPNLIWMAVAMFFAGAADGVSAIYRQTIWNEVIPTQIRGRMGSLNMLSYMIGPLLGNMRAGYMAAQTSVHFSILSGGLICACICTGCVWLFPKFWQYRRQA